VFDPSQIDSDNDGVPDGCDVMKGLDPDLPSCSNAACPIAIDQVCVYEITAGGSDMLCSKHADTDLDGLADVVDLCPGFTSANNENTNATAEDLAIAAPKADPCDPAPVLKLEAVFPPKVLGPGPPLPTQQFATSAVVGKVSAWTADAAFSANQAFRACSCVYNGVQVMLKDCIAPTGPCFGLNPLSTQAWKAMSVISSNGVPVPASGSSTDFSTSAVGPARTWTWAWKQDYDNGVIAGPLFFDSLHAAIAAEASPPPAWFPQTSRELTHNLRHTFLLVQTGAQPWVTTKEDATFVPGWDFDPHGGAWLFDPRAILDPWDIFPEKGIPALVYPSADRLAAWEDIGAIDLTAGVDDALASEIRSRLKLWVVPVESRARLRAMGDVRQALLITPELTGALTGTPIAITAGDKGFLIRGSLTHETGLAASTARSVLTPAPRIHAAFSASANALFIAGGVDTDGEPADGIWRMDLGSATWQLATHKAAVQVKDGVIAMTFDPDRNWLYVLGYSDVAALPGTPKWVSLTVYDLLHDRSKVLRSWAYTKKSLGIYLTLLEGGDLALTTSTNHDYSVQRFSTDGTSLVFKGVSGGKGRVPFGPVLGDRHLVVPAQKAKRLRYDLITSYAGGVPCAAL
jgi:hypothetical protein